MKATLQGGESHKLQAERWHGFSDADVADDYCLLDPTKVTILTPGVDPRGILADWEIPAGILRAFPGAGRLSSAAQRGARYEGTARKQNCCQGSD